MRFHGSLPCDMLRNKRHSPFLSRFVPFKYYPLSLFLSLSFLLFIYIYLRVRDLHLFSYSKKLACLHGRCASRSLDKTVAVIRRRLRRLHHVSLIPPSWKHILVARFRERISRKTMSVSICTIVEPQKRWDSRLLPNSHRS